MGWQDELDTLVGTEVENNQPDWLRDLDAVIPKPEATLGDAVKGGFYSERASAAFERGTKRQEQIEQRKVDGWEPEQVDGFRSVDGQPRGSRTSATSGKTDPAYGLIQDLNQQVDRTTGYLQQFEATPRSEALDKVASAKTMGEAASAFVESPLEVTGHALASSAWPMAQTVAGSVVGARGGLLGAAAGGGLASARMEYNNKLMEEMGKKGYDLRSPAGVRAAINDTAGLAEAHDKAVKKAAVVGAFDAASMGMAGKVLSPNVLKNAAAQTVIQSGFGMAGEAGGQLAADGGIDSPGEVLIEGIAELPGGIVQTTIAAHAQRAAIGQQVDDLKQAATDEYAQTGDQNILSRAIEKIKGMRQQQEELLLQLPAIAQPHPDDVYTLNAAGQPDGVISQPQDVQVAESARINRETGEVLPPRTEPAVLPETAVSGALLSQNNANEQIPNVQNASESANLQSLISDNELASYEDIAPPVDDLGFDEGMPDYLAGSEPVVPDLGEAGLIDVASNDVVKPESVSNQVEEINMPDFLPTHELPDGTAVIPHDEESNVWIDRDGFEYEDNNAARLENRESDLPAKQRDIATGRESGDAAVQQGATGTAGAGYSQDSSGGLGGGRENQEGAAASVESGRGDFGGDLGQFPSQQVEDILADDAPESSRTKFAKNFGFNYEDGIITQHRTQQRNITKAVRDQDMPSLLGALSKHKNRFVRRIAALAKGNEGLSLGQLPDWYSFDDADSRARQQESWVGAGKPLGVKPIRESSGMPRQSDGGGSDPSSSIFEALREAKADPRYIAAQKKLDEQLDSIENTLSGKAWRTKSAELQGEFRRAVKPILAEYRRARFESPDGGVYDPVDNSVLVDTTSKENPDIAMLVHEITHAVTVRAMMNPTAAQRPVVEKIQAVFRDLQAHTDLADEYGLTNSMEMVAEAWSNPEFQFKLSRITLPEQRQSLFNTLTKWIAKLLGVQQSALEQVIGLTEELVEARKRDKGKEAQLQASKAAPTADQFASNTIFTPDAVEAARARLKKKLGNLNSGFDPEIMADGLVLAGAYIESGVRSFSDYATAMVTDIGDGVQPYLLSFYEGARYFPELNTTGMDDTATAKRLHDELLNVDTVNQVNQEQDSVSSTTSSLESDSDPTPNEDDAVSGAVSDTGGGDRSDAGAGRGRTGETGAVADGGDVVSNGRSATERARGNKRVDQQRTGGESDGVAGGTTRGVERNGGRDVVPAGESSTSTGGAGVTSDGVRTTVAVAPNGATAGLTLKEKVKLQEAAESVQHVINDLDNIRATLPVLLPAQQEDVKFAEERFDQPDADGVLFTNGTGTGKTFTGLGLAKRFARQGQDNILVLVPGSKVAADWVSSGKYLGLSIKSLSGIVDNGGTGPVVTTYANFQQNRALLARDWDLIIPDEAHRLTQGADGKVTKALRMLRALSNKNTQDSLLWRSMLPDYDQWLELQKDVNKLRAKALSFAHFDDVFSNPFNEWPDASKEAALAALYARWESLKAAGQARSNDAAARIMDGAGNYKVSKVAFLSASPFAYHKSLVWADGFLFDSSAYGDKSRVGGYNVAQGFDALLQDKFGYHMRTGKLNQPGAEVNVALAERNFNTELKQDGVIRGRKLDVPADYSREFVLINDAIGSKIDEGISWLSKHSKEFAGLSQQLNERFDHLARLQLLEALKVKHAVKRARQHIKLGRKVVMFHDYKQGGSFAHPFKFKPSEHISEETIRKFELARPDLVALPLDRLPSPMAAVRKAFNTRVRLFNGDVAGAQRIKNVEAFNTDNGPVDVILIQRQSGKEGISLHDTSGVHQRVLIDLGLPTRPTDAIQTEGRIYRTGLVTDAIVEYFTTGLNYENHAFSEAVAMRSSTAENLAMGHEGRNMLRAFVDAYQSATTAKPKRAQGKGGKEKDYQNTEVTPMAEAQLAYYTRQKNTKTRASREGKDYYATPEPVGLKMVEWLGLKPGEHGLEPSAGHGAIARAFPDHANNTFIEPSYGLRGELGMLANGAVKQDDFLDFRPARHFEGVAMNPPFGQGGSDAIRHLARAFEFTRDGGRVVALIPEGGSTDTKFNRWFDSTAANDGYQVASISLPQVTFKRAGTGVKTRIVVIDKIPKAWLRKGAEYPINRDIDLSEIEGLPALFNAIDEVSLAGRTPAPAAEAKTSGAKLSRASTPSSSTIETVRQALTDRFKGRIRFLERSGKLVIRDSPVMDMVEAAFKGGSKVAVIPASSQIDSKAGRVVLADDQFSVDEVMRAVDRGDKVVVRSDDPTVAEQLQVIC